MSQLSQWKKPSRWARAPMKAVHVPWHLEEQDNLPVRACTSEIVTFCTLVAVSICVVSMVVGSRVVSVPKACVLSVWVSVWFANAVVVTVLRIEVATVRTEARTAVAVDAEAETPLIPPDDTAEMPGADAAELAAAEEATGVGDGCGTKTGSTRTLSSPTYAWPTHRMIKTPAWLLAVLGELEV